MAIPETLKALSVPVSGLKPYSRNARQGDVGLIVSSLERLGQFRPIVVNARTSEVLAGNHTLRAAQELGWTEIAATFVDVDEDTAARINLVDNRANDQAAYDDQALADLLQSLPDLAGTGYDGDALDELLADLGAGGEPGRDTDPMEPPAEPRTQVGDLYVLGEHRLLCGDARLDDDVRRLMEGVEADVMWTDPPYGVSYVGKTADALTIDGDDAEGLEGLLAGSFEQANGALKAGAAIYIAHPPGPAGHTFNVAFLGAGWRWRQTLCWLKDSMVLGHSDYHYRHESILYGYTSGEGRRGRGGDGWYGDNSQTSVLSFDRPKASPDHPTGKPVDLVEHCLRNSSEMGHVILDPFLGSGTTLIASENINRACYGLELDPGYCDVIVDRWERHTGKTAERITDGETVEAHA